MPDLWPSDLGTTESTPPVTLLREQAALLGEKTNNLVEGKVVRLEDRLDLPPELFAYAFYLVAPALGNYRYKLLTVSFPVELYPVNIEVDSDVLPEMPGQRREVSALLDPKWQQGTLEAASEDEYKEILRAVFGAGKTRRVVAAIIAQSKY